MDKNCSQRKSTPSGTLAWCRSWASISRPFPKAATATNTGSMAKRDGVGAGRDNARIRAISGTRCTSILIAQNDKNFLQLIEMQPGTDLVINLSPLGLGEVWGETLDSVDELEGHGPFLSCSRGDES